MQLTLAIAAASVVFDERPAAEEAWNEKDAGVHVCAEIGFEDGVAVRWKVNDWQEKRDTVKEWEVE